MPAFKRRSKEDRDYQFNLASQHLQKSFAKRRSKRTREAKRRRKKHKKRG